MIISHEHRFIFLKTRKTAGTSLEIALSKHCGPRDVLTRIAARDEALRRQLGHPGPQNDTAPLSEYGAADVARRLRGVPKVRFWNHAPAHHVRSLLGPEVWGSYFKFCFERNPWDKTVSMYHWDRQFEPWRSMNFACYVRTRRLHHNLPLYSDAGAVIVDAIYRFEDLPAEIERLAARLGLTLAPLPSAKAGLRPPRHYSEWFDDADAAHIAREFAHEIRLHGYAFERRPGASASASLPASLAPSA